MSHAVFQTAQIMPINTQLPTNKLWLPSIVKLGPCHRNRAVLVVKAFTTSSPSSSPSSSSSSSGVSYGDSIALLERCFANSSAPASSSLGPVMKGQYGALGSVTLEKSKLDMSQKQSKSSPEVSSLVLVSVSFIWNMSMRWCSFCMDSRRELFHSWQSSFTLEKFERITKKLDQNKFGCN